MKIAKERNAKIKVIGHAIERTKDMPIAEHKIVNFMISDKRAHSVANIFIEKYGFPRNKLETEAVSDSKPLFKEIMPAGTVVGGKETLTSKDPLPEEAYPSQLKKETPTTIALQFTKGELSGIDGEEISSTGVEKWFWT